MRRYKTLKKKDTKKAIGTHLALLTKIRSSDAQSKRSSHQTNDAIQGGTLLAAAGIDVLKHVGRVTLSESCFFSQNGVCLDMNRHKIS